MRKSLFVAAAWGIACAGAWAQPSGPRALPPEDVPTREQRRLELRTMLQAHQAERQADSAAQGGMALPLGRHLSEQERAEIRQQLRQQRQNKAQSTP